MEILRTRALKTGPLIGEPWAKEKDFIPLLSSAYRTKDGVTVILRAPIEKVQAVLARALKPGRVVLSAAQAKDGSLSEVPPPFKEDAPPALPADTERAATVAAPVIGCPMPEFTPAEARASRVLEAFLSPRQYADYREKGVFLAEGRDTGHRYAIVLRTNPEAIARYGGGRQLYDIDERAPLCVHDWTVPAPEEMLSLFLCVSLPGRERLIRLLPEARQG